MSNIQQCNDLLVRFFSSRMCVWQTSRYDLNQHTHEKKTAEMPKNDINLEMEMYRFNYDGMLDDLH